MPDKILLKPGMIIYNRLLNKHLVIVSMIEDSYGTYTIKYLTDGSKKIEANYNENGYVWTNNFKVLNNE